MTGIIVDAPQLLFAGVGDFFGVLGDLDLGDKDAVFPNGCKFIDGAENRIALGGNEALADAEGVDAAALIEQGANGVFIEAVGGHNFTVLKACSIEHAACFLGEIGKISGVNANALQAIALRL